MLPGILEDLTTPVYGRIGFSIVFVYLRKKGLVLGTKSSLELLPGMYIGVISETA